MNSSMEDQLSQSTMETPAELIPGLPECLGRECLFRLPFHALRRARNVSKKWNEVITSPSFYRLRKAAGFACPVVALLRSIDLRPSSVFDDDDDDEENDNLFYCSTRIALFEPITGVWTKVPTIPGRLISYCYMAAVGYELVLIVRCDGGAKELVMEVHVFNMITGTWRQGEPMPPLLRRYSAAYASGPRAVFLAGGNDQCRRRLKSALSYDVPADEWVRLPNMSRPLGMYACRGMFADGAFRVLEFDAYQNNWRSADEFDVEAGRWKKSERKIESAICVAAAEGREYVCRDQGWRKLEVLEFVGGEGGRGEVLDAHGGTVDAHGWRRLGVLPRDGLKPTYMVAWNGGLMVFNRQAAHVLEIGCAAAGEKNKWKRMEWSNDSSIKRFPCIFQL